MSVGAPVLVVLRVGGGQEQGRQDDGGAFQHGDDPLVMPDVIQYMRRTSQTRNRSGSSKTLRKSPRPRRSACTLRGFDRRIRYVCHRLALKRRDGWTMDDLARQGKARAMAGTIPGAVERIPAHIA